MDALEALRTRRSPLRLTEPAPPAEVLDAAYAAALNAPDHGRLKPWKFVQIGAGARQAFGQVLASALKLQKPDASAEELSREADKPSRAPLIIAVAATAQAGHKIPVIEQVMSAACAAQNLIVALHAQGFGCLWKTGAPAYDSHVKSALGLAETDQIVGFIYTGTVKNPAMARAPHPVSDFVKVWHGAA